METIRSWKKWFWKFEDTNCIKSLIACIIRLFYIGIQLGIMMEIDILLNSKKYNLKIMQFALTLGFLIFY